jgi:hypothetical protein
MLSFEWASLIETVGVQVGQGKGFEGGVAFERIVEICGKVKMPYAVEVKTPEQPRQEKSKSTNGPGLLHVAFSLGDR